MVHRRVIMGCILSVQGTGALQRPQTGVRTVRCKVQPAGIRVSRLHVVDMSISTKKLRFWRVVNEDHSLGYDAI